MNVRLIAVTGTYGCACVSLDARECTARRYGTVILGPCFDDGDEYAYTHAERCECQCHNWEDDDDDQS